jgi:hypothetical protein
LRRRPTIESQPEVWQDRDTLPALDIGKAEWPSLREAIGTKIERPWFDGGKATSFMRHKAETHRFLGPRHASRLGHFAMDAPKTRQWHSPIRQFEGNPFLSVNYLTLSD